jgi:hypothetical protein
MREYEATSAELREIEKGIWVWIPPSSPGMGEKVDVGGVNGKDRLLCS